ncbi:serine hydrolase FSH [Dichotomocladium elegans]|nr:serine hydrolase FSH [Dichotomocladium elegans]
MKNKLRILCLHGYAQNAILFRKKTAALFRDMEDTIERVYVRGPHVVLDPEYASMVERATKAGNDVSEELRPYAWWFANRQGPGTDDGYYYGFKDTMAYIKKILLEEGPFDGVLGFSQGACLAGILAHALEFRSLPDDNVQLLPRDFPHPPLQFVILAGGFKPLQQATKGILYSSKRKVETRSLHMIGEVDTVVAPERMDALTAAFKNPVIFRHAGGHFVPSTAAARKSLASFLADGCDRESRI